MSAPLKVLAVAVTAAAGFGAASVLPADPTAIVSVAAGSFAYRQAGEYLSDGVPVNAPVADVAFAGPLAIMQRQVSAREYEACVEAGACKPLAAAPAPDLQADLPAVGVSFLDASAYAAWLSRRTGHRYRLPTDAEWAFAAAERFHDDALAADGDPNNPATRWLQAYDSDAAAVEAVGTAARPFGSFGANANGVVDLAGNVWEWTSTCFARHAANQDGATVVETCGVRVVEGAHRAYLSDFVRNARGGACSAGAPPSNLGFRLVRDEGSAFDRVAAGLRRLLGAA